jgi:hypothetical protein
VIGTESGVFQLGTNDVTPLSVYAAAGEPVDTGAISAIASRSDGVLVAAENGVFHSYESKLLLSPISAALAGQNVVAMAVSGAGDDELVWVATDSRLLAVSADLYDEIVILEESGAPTVLGAAAGVVVAVYDNRVYEIDVASWTYAPLPALPGSVHSVASRAGVLAFATAAGVLVRDPSGSYTRFSLADNEESVWVEDVAVDGNGRALGLIEAGLIGAASGAVEGLGPHQKGASTRLLTSDGYGNAWIAADEKLTGLLVGDPVSFAESVQSILQTNCNSCHTSGTSAPYQDLGSYATAKALAADIVQRVSTGQMPPKPIAPLSDDDYQTLISWYATGLNP